MAIRWRKLVLIQKNEIKFDKKPWLLLSLFSSVEHCQQMISQTLLSISASGSDLQPLNGYTYVEDNLPRLGTIRALAKPPE